MNVIRLWKLGKMDGDHSTWVLPTRVTIEKFKELLERCLDGKGDLIWGPDIECQVISTEVVDTILVPVKVEDGEVLYRIAK